jgi:hypothetical protein
MNSRDKPAAAEGPASQSVESQPQGTCADGAEGGDAVAVAAAVLRAEAGIAAGDIATAAEAYTEALALSPHDAALRSSRSACYQRLGRVEEALADAQQAVLSRPRLTAAHAALGAVFRLLGKHCDEVAALRRAVELDTKREMVRCALSMLSPLMLTLAQPHLAELLQAAQAAAAESACIAQLSLAASPLVWASWVSPPGANAASSIIAVLTRTGELRLWDVSSPPPAWRGVTAQECDDGAPVWVWACCSPCGAMVAAGASDGSAKLWRIEWPASGDGAASAVLAHSLQVRAVLMIAGPMQSPHASTIACHRDTRSASRAAASPPTEPSW